MRRHYLHTRNGIFNAEFVSPEGRKLAARGLSTSSINQILLLDRIRDAPIGRPKAKPEAPDKAAKKGK
jgi:hypothetical protein